MHEILGNTVKQLPIDFEYQAAFEKWRSSRDAFKNLTKAIRSGAGRKELDPLASKAGLSLSELLGLITQRSTALSHKEELEQLPAARAAAREAKEKRDLLSKKLDVPMSPREEELTRDQLRVAASVAEALQRKADVLSTSGPIVSAAKECGII